LWLSTDDNPANKVLIAYAESSTDIRQYNKFSTQKSAPVRLIKGARYYIETLHKEAFGADHVSVAWTLPDALVEAPIPGIRLSPFTAPLTTGTRVSSSEFATAMRLKTVEEKAGGLKVTATPNPSQHYFTLLTSSKNTKSLNITLTDVAGRIVERKLNVAANGTVQVGHRLPAGIYFIEVIQDNQKQKLKLVKQ
ncbi:MAG: T9SS type A sorting domain-containing protein, partial [Ferruginibacter sp.]